MSKESKSLHLRIPEKLKIKIVRIGVDEDRSLNQMSQILLKEAIKQREEARDGK